MSNAVFKGEEGFALKQKINLEKTEDIQATESSEDARVEGNDWCTYLILSNDKRKTYLGVTANLSRRYVLFFYLVRNVVLGYEFHSFHLVGSIPLSMCSLI